MFSKSDQMLTRGTTEYSEFNRGLDETACNNIIELIDGGGRSTLKEAVINRFCSEIVKAADSDMIVDNGVADPEGGFGQIINQAQATAYAAGLHTVASMFTMQRIISARSTLFDAESEYTYNNPGMFTEALPYFRELAFVDLVMSRTDELATGIGSSAVWITASPVGFRYQALDPTKIWIVPAVSIESGNTAIGVDSTNVEHAYVVVIETQAQSSSSDGSDANKRSFVAYFGRCEEYPNGRYVEYSGENWKDIPEYGTEAALDYTTSGDMRTLAGKDEIANPLTLNANQSNKPGAEYPVVIWHGDKTAYGTTIMPVTGGDLYEQSFEYDVEFSRVIESGGRSAAGVWVFGNESGIDPTGPWNEGMVQLERGQTASLLSHEASNAKDAMQILLNAKGDTAERYNVPSYMVATKEDFQVASGYALDVMNMPLDRDRQARANVNRSGMARKFQIEKQLANAVEAGSIPVEATEAWEPGVLERPSLVADVIAENQFKLDNALTSPAEILKETRNIATKEEALKLVEEYRAEKPEEKAQGLLGRFK